MVLLLFTIQLLLLLWLLVYIQLIHLLGRRLSESRYGKCTLASNNTMTFCCCYCCCFLLFNRCCCCCCWCLHNSLATKERLIESQTGNCTASASNKSNSSGKIWRHGGGGHGAASWYSYQTVAHK